MTTQNFVGAIVTCGLVFTLLSVVVYRIADTEPTPEERARWADIAARKKQQIDACLRAGGVPFYYDSGELHYCTLPPCGGQR